MNASTQPAEGAGGSRSRAAGELTLGLLSGEERRCTPICLCSSVGVSLLAMAACQPTNFSQVYPIPCGSELARDSGLTANDNPLAHTSNVARELAPAGSRSGPKPADAIPGMYRISRFTTAAQSSGTVRRSDKLPRHMDCVCQIAWLCGYRPCITRFPASLSTTPATPFRGSLVARLRTTIYDLPLPELR